MSDQTCSRCGKCIVNDIYLVRRPGCKCRVPMCELCASTSPMRLDNDDPTLGAVCSVLGADVDSVEAQAAMMVEQAKRVRPLEAAALEAMGWLRARLAEPIGSSAVRDAIADCVDRIWALVSDGAKEGK